MVARAGGEDAAQGRVRGGVAATAGALAVLLAAFQLARWGLESLAFAAVPHTLLSNELVRTAVYLVLCGVLVLVARARGVRLSAAPAGSARSAALYGVAFAAFAALFAATPFVTGQAAEPAAWAALACGCLATPLFEELLFRGYVWERLRAACSADWQVLVASAALFGLWHLGYTDAVAWRLAQPDMAAAQAGLGTLVLAKVGFAAVLGVVLGYLRLRSGGCLAPMVFHGAWNLLA